MPLQFRAPLTLVATSLLVNKKLQGLLSGLEDNLHSPARIHTPKYSPKHSGLNHPACGEQPKGHALPGNCRRAWPTPCWGTGSTTQPDYFRTVDGSMPRSWLVPVPFKGKISCIRIKTLCTAVISNIKLKGGYKYLWLSVWLNLKLLGRRKGLGERFCFRHLSL